MAPDTLPILLIFLQHWNIQHKTDIPYNPTSQPIVERMHHTFKNLKKQKMGSHESSPQILTMFAMFTYIFLNCDESLCTPIGKHFQTKESKLPFPQVLYRDLLGDSIWQGPIDLLTWRRGYACVSIATCPVGLPAKRVKPYHERGRHQAPLSGAKNQSTDIPDGPADTEQPEGNQTHTVSHIGLDLPTEDGVCPNDRGRGSDASCRGQQPPHAPQCSL